MCRLTAGGLFRPALQNHSLVSAAPGVLQEGRAVTVHTLGTGTHIPFTEADIGLGIHAMVAPGEGHRCDQQLAGFQDILHEK